MITIRKLGEKFSLSLSTLLYYDKIGLLSPSARTDAGYRLYNDRAVEQLRQISAYKSAGLSLRDIAAIQRQRNIADDGIFRRRLGELDAQIGELRLQQRAIVEMIAKYGDDNKPITIGRESWVEILRAAGMNDHDMQRWHEAFEKNSPDAHHSFLQWLGISEHETLKIRMQSKV